MEVGHVVHWNFKVDRNRSYFFATLCGSRVLESNPYYKGVLKSALELFDLPFCCLVLRFILCDLALNALRNLK